MSLRAVNITYERRQVALIENLSLDIKPGQLHYISGANGVGKTTLLRILTGNLLPTRGQIYWCNQSIHQDAQAYQQALHFIGHLPGIRQGLTVEENLKLLGRIQGKLCVENIEQALMQLRLTTLRHRIVKQLSSGQRKRVALAKLIMQPQPLWILDEPFNALDAEGVQLLYQLITNHLATKGQIVLTSHLSLQLVDIPIHELKLPERFAS